MSVVDVQGSDEALGNPGEQHGAEALGSPGAQRRDESLGDPGGQRSDEALRDPLLFTRMVVPDRPARSLRRHRLARHLDEGLATPLTLVNGPAGAGKTLAVADWAAGLDRPVAWLTAESGDRRPGEFWAYLLESLRRAGVALAVRVPADAVRVDRRMLALLAEELRARDDGVVAVVDEFERVTGADVAEQVEFVLRHAGGGLRLVLVARTEPLLPLHRYRVAGQLTEVRGAELAFTDDEAALLLELHGLRLPSATVHALVERTRGWAAGLRLCAMAALEADDPEVYLKEFEADRGAVADFLLAEVLARQPGDAQDLLLRTSVLRRFDPPLANALTGRSDAEPLLVGLHRENAFVEPLGHGWYRLHPLFREILLAHLRVRLPGLEPELHRRAAHRLLRSGDLAEALTHAAAAGDWDFAADALVDDLALGQYFTGLHAGGLRRLFAGMGAMETKETLGTPGALGTVESTDGDGTSGSLAPPSPSPSAGLLHAARAFGARDIGLGFARLARADQGMAGGEGSPRARVCSAFLHGVGARLTGDPDLATRALHDFSAACTDVPSALLGRHPELRALLLVQVGAAYVWGGRFEEARAVLAGAVSGDDPSGGPRAEALELLALIDQLYGWPRRAERKVPVGAGTGLGALVLAAVAIERDDLDRAQALLDETTETTERTGTTDTTAIAGMAEAARAVTATAAPAPPLPPPGPLFDAVRALVRARLMLARGHPRGVAPTPPDTTPTPSPWIDAQRAALALAGAPAARRAEAAEGLAAAGHPAPLGAVEAAWLLLAAGRARDAAALVGRVRGDHRAGPAVTVRAALVRARLAELAGDAGAARRLLGQALLDGRRERLRRPFLDAGAWVEPLLSTEPLDELAAGWLPYGEGVSGEPPPVGELSEREREVLRRLAGMMSAQEIAADLCVSVNTVKTHLKGVYRKLAVNRRNDAVRRARELGLL
ncbi:LuxR C-terminal-related transcriptional regulator [Streptomyces sp. NPDC004610]|uniref:LuxR C-terminal-related transcriptional regulator n=1 Tax=unclassified Streptomyces TaxID=2593676 RepID=UPI0033AD93CE